MSMLLEQAVPEAVGLQPNKSFDADTQRHCVASRARKHTPGGAMPLRAGQLRR